TGPSRPASEIDPFCFGSGRRASQCQAAAVAATARPVPAAPTIPPVRSAVFPLEAVIATNYVLHHSLTARREAQLERSIVFVRSQQPTKQRTGRSFEGQTMVCDVDRGGRSTTRDRSANSECRRGGARPRLRRSRPSVDPGEDFSVCAQYRC